MRVFLELKGMNEVDFVYKVVVMLNVFDEGRSFEGFINFRKIYLEMDGEGNVISLLFFV